MHDQFGADDDIYTLVNVKVNHLKYAGGEEFYDISYRYSYSHGNEDSRQGYPFPGDLEEHSPGDIIVVNELSSALTKYLLMDIDELGGYSGRVHPNTYKLNVMHAITNFWD